ncbi:MAG: ATP-binding cassette domain-containing protein [Anaerolineae bacterium]|nr:ATP-binding cassette domain-containing protein [Anaerolineae bacterium]
MIEVDDLTVCYGQQRVLGALSLSIRPGEFVLVTGPSGCGKSTLLRALAGLIPHASLAHMKGRVVVDGLDTQEHSLPILAGHIGLVFQNPATQLFCLRVEEEVAFGPRNLGLPPDEVARRVEWAIAATGLEHLRGRRVNTLSDGEKQRLAIAAVLAMSPRILILDEPTSNLDMVGTRQVLSTLERLRRGSSTVVVAEHKTREVSQLAGRVLILEKGLPVADGSPAEVFARREMLHRLGVRRPIAHPQSDWADLIAPNEASILPSLPGRGWGRVKPLVELEGVVAGYGKRQVLAGLDLSIQRGELVALVGDNGAGKTTVARLLAGLVKPRRGKVQVRGKVGLLFQNPLEQLFCETVEEEVAFGPRNYGLLTPALLEDTLAVADLGSLRHRRTHALSGGEQQRTALASVLALRLDLLILDEPTMGQDWGHLTAFMDHVGRLNGRGMAILLITHDYRLVHDYAQRVLLLRNGRIAAEGSPRRAVKQSGLPRPRTGGVGAASAGSCN